MEFKKGDKVLIKADIDGTEHLGDKVGIVVATRPENKDIKVKIPGVYGTWWVWNHNATLVEE